MFAFQAFLFTCKYFFLGPDENPANVQGIGSEPDNLVITWEVSLGGLAFLLLVFRCVSNFFF